MKKTYSKPEIMFESFALSNNIAANCGTVVNSNPECAYVTRSGHHVFLTGIQACTTKEDDGDYNGICYDIPVEAASLFNS